MLDSSLPERYDTHMDYKAQIMKALGDLEVTPQTIAQQLAQVIRGETITERYDGEGELRTRTVKTEPQDVMRGAMIYDAIHGGELGIAPRTTDFKKPAEIAHKRMLIDTRIIVSSEDMDDET
mgnify:CR=1 FL=1